MSIEKQIPEAGKILIAQPFMMDGNFKRAVIGITEHGSKGTVGFVLNKEVKAKLEILIPEIKTEENFRIHYGGPVATDTLHYIHNVGDLLDGSTQIKKGLYWGGDFEKLLFLINSGLILERNIRFYVGYSGWSEGQLDEEMKGGTWIVSKWYPNYNFQSKPDQLWSQCLEHKGNTYSVIGKIPNSTNYN